MKITITFTVLFLIPLFVVAQINFNVLEPTSVSGDYDFTWGMPENGWGCPDFNIPNTYVQDTLMLVEDGTPGINDQGNPISQEGCYPLTNDLSGKIAVCWRNSCYWYDKALNAQNAGAKALIIISRDDELVELGVQPPAGPDIIIPITYIRFDDGMDIVEAMQNGPVVVFIGNGNAGINWLDADQSKLYPNPAQDEFIFTWPQSAGICSIELHNLEGKLMQKMQASSTSQTIDVRNLSNGVYILSGQGEHGTLKKRVVVRH
tara:strand:- start:13 stop:795 length:783 start_codon:yes stop_codon:yes gene_type:complete